MVRFFYHTQKIRQHKYFTLSLKAFSLLEFSIVLVVIGIMATGVMKGKELIRFTRIKAVAEQIQSYQNAVLQFRSTYNAWPGNYSHAAQILSKGCKSGKGDGKITTGDEAVQFWRHLWAAGYICGIEPAAPLQPCFGQTLPESQLGGGFMVMYEPNNKAGHWLVLTGAAHQAIPFLSSSDAHALVCALKKHGYTQEDVQVVVPSGQEAAVVYVKLE